MKKKSILLTGARGFLGKSVYSHLTNSGYSLIPLVRHTNGLTGEIVLDLEHGDIESQCSKLPHFDAIIHLAAKADFSSRYDKELFIANTLATYHLAKLSEKRNAHCIFASMAGVHGARTSHITEDSPIKLDTPYSFSKWLAEEALKKICRRYSIIRFSGIYGPAGPTHLGINNAISRALNGMPPVLIGEGFARRNYIFVEDAAIAIENILEKELLGTYLCAGAQELSIREMLYTICNVLISSTEPIKQEGAEANDQIVESSALMPRSRPFEEALVAIKNSLL